MLKNLVRRLIVFASYPLSAVLDSAISKCLIENFNFISEGNPLLNQLGFFSPMHILFLVIVSINVLLAWIYLEYWRDVLPSFLRKISSNFPVYASSLHIFAIIYNTVLLFSLYNPSMSMIFLI